MHPAHIQRTLDSLPPARRKARIWSTILFLAMLASLAGLACLLTFN